MAANKEAAAASFNEIIKAGRKKKEHERLAQQMLGKRRASTPSNIGKKNGLAGSLASRVGVAKRPSSLSRSQSSQARLPQTKQENPPPRQPRATSHRQPRGNAQDSIQINGSSGLSIKGAASGPYIVIASNFAPGTTAADIESVMASVGGEVTYCKIVAAQPTCIAEMGFKERSGADNVIETFNNKKADGRVLYVHMKDGSVPTQRAPEPQQVEEQYDEGAMEVDENARSREAENKIREERRGTRDDRVRQDVFPSGPRNNRAFGGQDDYYQDNRGYVQDSGYQDGRQGFNNSGYRGQGQPRFFEDRRGGYGRGNAQYRN